MAGWFEELMQQAHGRSRRSGGGGARVARHARHDAIVRMLRERDPEDRAARERRQRGYRQSLEIDTGIAGDVPDAAAPVRLQRFRTKVPCRTTPEARALLQQLAMRFPVGIVTFAPAASGRQPLLLTGGGGTEPVQIGWIEHRVEADPARCNVRHQGLSVETDGGTMLVLRFSHPPTAVRTTARRDEVRAVDFAELRTALEPRPAEQAAPPRLVWVTRQEAETMSAVRGAARCRDYESFYVRFKLEVLAGVWTALCGLLPSGSGARWHEGAYYTVVREPDPATGRIYQRTLDDAGCAVDVGADRIYDAVPATDILLLYLDADILADVADIHFTLQGLPSADAYFLKEELFAVVRRFWAGARSLPSRYGGDLPAVVRMSRRAVPMPAQALLLQQDWTTLRQTLIDRYGEGGRKVADLAGGRAHRASAGADWPFGSFAAGDVNLGLRVIHRQEWRHLGAGRGEVIRTVPPAATRVESSRIETTIEREDPTWRLDDVVDGATDATIAAMRWTRDLDGCVDTGARGLATTSDIGLEAECRERSRDAGARLTEVMVKTATAVHAARGAGAGAEPEALDVASASAVEELADRDAATCVYSRLQQRYEVITRPAELQHVVLVAEQLPSRAEIDLAWVRRHDWILAKVLLDESFRDALETIGEEPRNRRRDLALQATRDRLYEHLAANVLHYQRAIWQQEDPQQRSMRYRRWGTKVPLEWRFELDAGGAAMTIEELAGRLGAPNVDGQFSAYSGGREAELDQVIDPAGPIAFHGNYAVYGMRPELGDEALFSMLHFFKSPYLRPSPDGEEPELEHGVQTAREIAFDTRGVVVDVARAADAAPAATERGDGGLHLLRDVPADYRLLVDGGCGVALLETHGRRDAGGNWAIVRNGAERPSSLVAGTGAGGAHDEPVIVARHHGARPHLLAGRARDADGERTLVARDARWLRFGAPSAASVHPIRVDGARLPALWASAGARPADERPIRVPHDGEAMPGLRAGRGHEPETEGVIVLEDGAPRLGATAGGGAAPAHERVLVARREDWLRPSLVAG